jgi:hypothetical protein
MVGVLWIGVGGFVLYVLSLAMSPSAIRTRGGDHGGTSPLAS